MQGLVATIERLQSLFTTSTPVAKHYPALMEMSKAEEDEEGRPEDHAEGHAEGHAEAHAKDHVEDRPEDDNDTEAETVIEEIRLSPQSRPAKTQRMPVYGSAASARSPRSTRGIKPRKYQ